MTDFPRAFVDASLSTVLDIAPIVILLLLFQLVVLRRKPPNLSRIAAGSVLVFVGLALFLIGLENALFPIGKTMAQQLTSPETIGAARLADGIDWHDYLPVYAFAAAIGFATTVAEPSLVAVAIKARDASGGTVHPWGLRIAVAVGVAVGVSLGCLRIVTGTPLPWYIIGSYIVVMLLTFRSSRSIVPLAYDSGGVTTSTVTVPVVAALGLGLAASVPGRSPLIDGFGLIAFASVFPIITVLGYSIATAWLSRRRKSRLPKED